MDFRSTSFHALAARGIRAILDKWQTRLGKINTHEIHLSEPIDRRLVAQLEDELVGYKSWLLLSLPRHRHAKIV